MIGWLKTTRLQLSYLRLLQGMNLMKESLLFAAQQSDPFASFSS